MAQTTYYDPVEKIWSGPKSVPLYNKNVSMGWVLLNALQANSDFIGQISADSGIELTNGEIRLKTVRAAQNLATRGFKAHDVFSIIASNSHHLAPIVLAGLALGAPIQTMDISFSADDISHMVQVCQPKAIFCNGEIIGKVRKAINDLGINVAVFVFGGPVKGETEVEELFKPTGKEFFFKATHLDDGYTHPAFIVCTSGTTGRPKGVSISHAVLLNEISKMAVLGCSKRIFSFSSLYWLSGVFPLLMGTLSSCTRIITTDKFTPELFLSLIEKYKLFFIFAPPSQVAMMLACKDIKTTDFSSIGMFTCGGSVVPSAIAEAMGKYLPSGKLFVGYGMSELGGGATINFSKLGSVGKVSDGIKIKLINESGDAVGPNEEGEVCIQTPLPLLGYYGNESATRSLIDEDGWVHSGDIGYFDDSEFLFIVDRKKDIFKYMNFHISPSEIEEVIQELPYVELVSVTSVPDPIATDLPAALVILAKGMTATESMIYDHVASHMPDNKKLRGGVYFVDSLPLTASGKVVKRAVKEIAISLFNKRKTLP